MSLCLPASVGVILTGWSFSYFIQEDIFVGRDMLQELAFFLVLLTAGLEISILHLKPYFFVLALVPCTAELLAIAAYSVYNLGFTWAEGLNLGTVLVAVGDGLVIPKMKEFSVLHKQHPMPYLMLCWAPVEASYALTLFGVFTAVSAPATMPSLNIVLLLASTMIRIAATVVAGAALGYAAWFLIDKRREATLFGHQVFTNQPVEAFLMLLAVALCAYGLGSNTKGRPTLPLFFGCGSLFQPELMVIVTGSTFAMCCERYNSQNLLAQVEQIMGGVWVFAQLILFAMLGSKTSPSIFPTLVTVLPIMAVGLLARFAGVLLSVRATTAQRRTENQGLGQALADACFCFLSVLPRATIQGALGAVPVNQRFFQDEAREDRSEARHLIFTAARLYIFCMSIFGMFLLNTFGPMLLEASEERPPEEEAFIHDRFASDLEQFDDRGFHFDSHDRDEKVIDLAETLGQEYGIPASMVMSLLDERSKALSPVRGGLSPIREHRDIDKVQVSGTRSEELSDLSPSAKTDPVRSASARFVGLRARFETEPAPQTKWKELQMKRTWSKMDNFALFDSRGPQVEEDHSAVQGRYRGYTH